MTFMPSPVNHWHENPTSGAALSLARLVPYKTAAGYWVLLERGTQPAGATQGAAIHGVGYDTLTTSTTSGLRHARRGDGIVLSY